MRKWINIINEGITHEWLWHGSDNTNALKILKQGLKPNQEVSRKVGSKYIPAARNGIYLTPDFLTALSFASMNSRSAYGWIFGISNLTNDEFEIDEDEIGQITKHVLSRVRPDSFYRMKAAGKAAEIPTIRQEFLSLANQHLPSDIVNELSTYAFIKPSVIASVGNQLSPFLADETKKTLADIGCNIVYLKNVRPDVAYRFPMGGKLNGVRLADINNTFIKKGLEAALALMEKVR